MNDKNANNSENQDVVNNESAKNEPENNEPENNESEIKLVETKSLEMEAGWRWVVDGFDTFKKSPGLWIGMIIVLAIIMMIAGMIPFVGAILAPIFSAGFMYVCHKQYNDEKADFEDLFHGFKNQTAPLAIIGVVNLAASFVIGFVVLSITGVGAGLGAMGGDGGAIAGGIIGLLFGVLISMLLYIPVMMGLWFAPALVLFHKNLKPIDAMIMSFKACLKNFLPFIIYTVVIFIMAFIAAIPLGLGLLVAVPVIIASTYFGYRSIFTEM